MILRFASIYNVFRESISYELMNKSVYTLSYQQCASDWHLYNAELLNQLSDFPHILLDSPEYLYKTLNYNKNPYSNLKEALEIVQQGCTLQYYRSKCFLCVSRNIKMSIAVYVWVSSIPQVSVP